MNDKIDLFFTLMKEIQEAFGYKEDWVSIPLADFRDDYWMISSETGKGVYVHSEKPFTRETIEAGAEIYGGLIYTQRFLPKWVYRTETHTLVSIDTRTDGNKHLAIFSNKLECKDKDLLSLYERCWD